VVVCVDAFRRVHRALRMAARETLAATGVSAAQLFVLRCLEDGADASLSELAGRTMTDRSSVTAVVSRLREAGLVTRQRSADDGRRAAVAITGAGRTVLRRAPDSPMTLLMAGLGAIPGARLHALAGGMRALTETMGLARGPAGLLFEDGPDSHPSRRERR
jgi:DNA-binding MarR family transcriptional regulator